MLVAKEDIISIEAIVPDNGFVGKLPVHYLS